MHNGQLTVKNEDMQTRRPTASDAERAAGLSGRSLGHYADLLAQAQRDYKAAEALHTRAMRAMITYDDTAPQEQDVIQEILDDVAVQQAER